MKDSLILGMALGAIIGAFYVTSNSKAENLVEKSKKNIKKQVEKL